MGRVGLVRCIMVCLMASLQPACAWADQFYSFESGLEYFSGSYGSSVHTDIVCVPLTGKIRDRDWSAKASVPYLEMRGTGGMVNSIGQTILPANTHRVRAGWGDVNLSASWHYINGGASGLTASMTGKVKLATASAAKGLSTGKNDYAIETSLFKHSESLSPFGTVGYKMYGSPAGYALENVLYGSIGASFRLSQGSSLGAMFFAGQKVMATRPPRAEFILFGSHTLDRNWKVRGYFLRGFTTSVPDWGSGILVDYNFDTRKTAPGVAWLGYSDA